MMLLTKDNKKQLPALYAQDSLGDKAVAYVKFFDPCGSWTWYASEYCPEEGRFFGLVAGHEVELGYFTLGEMAAYRGPLGIGIERDRWFKPTTIEDLKKLYSGEDK